MKTTLTFTFLIVLAATFAIEIPNKAEKPSQPSDRFTPLGDLPGGVFYSVALGVSGDGSVVVGYSNTHSSVEPFRWTRNSGMVGLPRNSVHEDCWASAVSADGSVVAGWNLSHSGIKAFRWTPSSGKLGLRDLSGNERCGEVFGMSADGSAIVGRAENEAGEEAFRWSQDAGTVRLGKLPSGGRDSLATAASADGSVVVGWADTETIPGRCEAFRWTQQQGMVGLGKLAGDAVSRAYCVSADGLVVVGSSERSCGNGQAFRWTEREGMVGLGALPGGYHSSIAMGVSADGSIIVGHCYSQSGREAFVWDATHGMRSVRDVLVDDFDLGKSLKGWKLRAAYAVSADGLKIVGCGINPTGNMEAWVAHIPRETLGGGDRAEKE